MKALPHLYVIESEGKGRGVFTALEIPKEGIIEICPLILIPAAQSTCIDQTELYNYYFIWDNDHLAIALGYGSLYNHSHAPNAKVIYDFETEEIQIEAILDIEAGSEITINYLDDDDPLHGLWFEEK